MLMNLGRDAKAICFKIRYKNYKIREGMSECTEEGILHFGD